jgi:hypothetical protein
VTKKSYFTQPKFTFTKLGIKLVLSKLFHYQMKMFLMFFIVLGIDHYVVNKDYDKLVQEFHDLVHHMKYDGALVKPNGITVYSWEPYLVTKAVLGILYSLILS